MAELKTQPNDNSVEAFLDTIENEKKRRDAYAIAALMKEVTGALPKMWGPSIVGFGDYHYRYESGREGDWFLTGFSPRKQNLTLYIMAGFSRHDELMARLGKYKTGKACLYLNKLEDVDQGVLKELVEESVQYLKQKYG
ncbi:MAG: DUF1801 domain-containing protein [Phaeodactylibacter sp.]|nr:DUF1801 domain-containing protein [Phaeodactylibacter sp.]MCB9275355.1 DUF1801 domain-containing protein [Lewinellaceae bacterium]